MSSDKKWYPPELRPDFVSRPPELEFSDDPAKPPPLPWAQGAQGVAVTPTGSRPQLPLSEAPSIDVGTKPIVSAPAQLAQLRAPTVILGEVRPTRRRRRRVQLSWRGVVPVLAVVFFLGMVGAGVVAVKQNSTAGQWRSLDRTAVSSNRLLSKSLSSAHLAITTADTSIRSLNAHVSRLDGQINGLQTQLSAVANAKEKALDQNALLTRLTLEAGTVSNELSSCVDDMDSLLSEIDNDLASLSYNDPNLQSNANIASESCAAAQQENEQLQSILSGVG
jgi:hypothetical protein